VFLFGGAKLTHLGICRRTIAMAFVCSFFLGSAALSASKLPGDAATLTEDHDDWLVRCGIADKQVRCSTQQQQLSTQTRQLVLQIQLSEDAAGGLRGSLILPFGLDLTVSPRLSVDKAASPDGIAYKTCLPTGCIVPLVLGADWVPVLRAGTSLGVSAKSVDGQDANFAISLKGLGSAMDRMTELTK
jgi:invasion protein IalB